MEHKPKLLPNIIIGALLVTSHIRIVSSCPEECICKAEIAISCIDKSLDHLPEDISPEVQFLDVSYNSLTSIPRNISQHQNIKRLSLAHNRINSLGLNTFNGMNQLELLNISWNRFVRASDLHRMSLNNTPLLTTLDLSSNPLRNFPECESTSLEVLLLQNCSISGLNPGVLHVFPNLRTLDLSRNSIARIGGQFQSKSLVEFDLTDCQIKEVTNTALDKLKGLRQLHLARNYQLKSFGANSTSLLHLNLKDCNLESVPSSWLPNLTTLELSGNHIRRLEAGMFNLMPKVQNITLGDNSMDFIAQGSFDQLLYLRFLDLSHNTIRGLDVRTFKSNPSLELVNLSRNYIDVMIPFQSGSLKTLDLTNCEISRVAWSLLSMSKLNELILAGNLLNDIPVNLTSRSLTKLNLANNRITSLKNHTFHWVPLLRHVNLMGNRLVNMGFYYSFKNIRSMYVGDNPWRCECQSKSFEHLFTILNSINSDVDIARCHSPFSTEGKTWVEACGPEWFPWDFSHGDKAWIASAALMGSFIGSCCIFVAINKVCNKRKKREREAQSLRQEEQRERLVAMIQAASQHISEESRNAPDPRELQGPPSYNEAITMPPLGSTASLYSRKEEPMGSPSINGSVVTINNLNISQTQPLQAATNNNNVEVKQKTRRKKRPKSPHRGYGMNQAGSVSQLSDTNQSSSQMSGYVRTTSHTSEMSQSNPDFLDKSGRPLSAKTRRRRRRSQTRSQNMDNSSSDDVSVIETNM